MVDSLIHIEETLGQGARLLPVAGVEGGLAAARLVGVELYVDAVTSQDANGALSDLGKNWSTTQVTNRETLLGAG